MRNNLQFMGRTSGRVSLTSKIDSLERTIPQNPAALADQRMVLKRPPQLENREHKIYGWLRTIGRKAQHYRGYP
jgi:hypothetical protein